MNERMMNKLNADSIQNMDDVKTYLRSQEAITNHKFEQLETKTTEIRERSFENQNKIKRNLRFIMVSTWVSGCVLAIIITLSVVLQIIESVSQ